MVFLNPLLLIGLVAVVIPPVVHFFARRKYDEVAWGAMRFLRLSPKSRRKLLLEHWLLMAIRMAILGLLAVALAGPTVRSSFLARFEDRPARTAIVLIDASASAGFRHGDQTAADAAKVWAAAFLDRCRSGDRVALFAVRGEVVPLVGSPSADPEQIRAALELLPEPRGTADWPAAVEVASKVLDEAGDGEILVLGDGQRFGWSDADALARWELLARKRSAAGRPLPRVWAVNVVPDRPAAGSNAGLGLIAANRSVASAGTEVRFSSTIRRTGPPVPLPRTRLEIDGRPAGDIRVTAGQNPTETPFAFARRFGAGSHLVTLKLDPDGFPADNRQDFAIDVHSVIAVLIVDGGGRPDARSLRSDFLRAALAPTRDPAPAFAVRTVHPEQFAPAVLSQDVAGPGTRPQVLVLADVAALSAEQDRAVERFLGDGGGVLVALGDRCVPAAWRDGRAWLPARPTEVGGTEPDSPMVPKPEGADLDHPVSTVFRNRLLTGVVFPRYWKLRPDAGSPATVLAALTTGDPLFVERPAGSGRVIVSAVPLDNTWETNLVGLPGFVPLAHELCYHLAGTADTPANLSAGEPLVVRLHEGEPLGSVTVQPPDAQPVVVPARGGAAVFTATRDPGVYRATTPASRVRYFVVRPDPRESDLTASDESGRARVAQAAGSVEYVGSVDELQSRRGRGPVTRDLTGLLLMLVLALLVAELWYTRRLTGAGR